MQSGLTKYFALGAIPVLVCTYLNLPVQSKNLLAINKTLAADKTSARVAPSIKAQSDSFKAADGSGKLVAMLGSGKQLGQCPLKHTDVTCDVSGYVARVTVKQTFHNPYRDKIEALYTFPLSANGAVDEMLMKVGERTIHGTIKKRQEAKQIYDQAKANGQVASLLDQERTNIFAQSVANIEPGKEIEITIKYVETLPYEKGRYSFVFPTVVGPRFIPGNATGEAVQTGAGRSHNTDQSDASHLTPPVAPPSERAGHDISINIHLDAGMALSDLNSQLHQVNINKKGAGQADISLVDKNTIPNKDFVLSWNVAEDDLKSGYLTYRAPKAKEGFFTLMLVPPKQVSVDQIAPKEMIFVIDCSGSQNGQPLDKCKETMNYILDHMNADDTFQIIAFSDNTRTFAEAPQKVNTAMKAKAHKFIAALQANGGTWMAPAVEQACKTPADNHRLRIFTFMTDGYVGNDFEILAMVKKLRGTSRWFPFGTGNSVNRMLIEGIAKEGGGEPDFVLLNSSAKEAGKKFYDRIAAPLLTDIKLSIDGVKAKDVYPKEISDVWAERPLYFKGKYTAGGAGTIILTGYSAGKPYEQKLAVNFPDSNTKNPGIASLWARAKVDRLMAEDYSGAQNGGVNKELQDEITQTALTHHIMTQYTSFVAVDEKTVIKDGKLQTITVPVEMPDGVSRENIFGNNAAGHLQAIAPMAVNNKLYSRASRMNVYGGGGGNGAKEMTMMMAPRAYFGYGAGSAVIPAPPPLALSALPVSPMPQTKQSPGSRRMVSAAATSWYRSAGKSIVLDDRLAVNTDKKKTLAINSEAKADKGLAVDSKQKQIELCRDANLNKLSQRARLLLKNGGATVKGLTITDGKVLVIIKVDKINTGRRARLKALGLEIVGIEVKGEVKGLIKTSKLIDLASLDFVLSVLLASDRK